MFIRSGTKQEMFIGKDLVENILDYADRGMEDKTLEELEKHIGSSGYYVDSWEFICPEKG